MTETLPCFLSTLEKQNKTIKAPPRYLKLWKTRILHIGIKVNICRYEDTRASSYLLWQCFPLWMGFQVFSRAAVHVISYSRCLSSRTESQGDLPHFLTLKPRALLLWHCTCLINWNSQKFLQSEAWILKVKWEEEEKNTTGHKHIQHKPMNIYWVFKYWNE